MVVTLSMATFIGVFLVFAGIMLLMSIGLLLMRKPIKGSCGGMSALGMDTACDICGGNPQKCEEQPESRRVASQSTNTKANGNTSKKTFKNAMTQEVHTQNVIGRTDMAETKVKTPLSKD